MQLAPRPRVSIIIVSFNVSDELERCLNSLRFETVPTEIIVVDNASTDGTREMLSKMHQANLKTIYNRENEGLARANNEPMNLCAGDYLVILNPDTTIRKGALDALTSYLDMHENVGVVAPKIISSDGSVERSFFSRWDPIRDALFNSVKLPLRFTRQRRRDMTVGRACDVLFVSGACLMIRRWLFLELGGYDPNFFLALDDVVDLCLRVRRRGYRVVYYPASEIIHLGVHGHRGYGSIFWGYQGRLYYQAKYGSQMTSLLLRILLIADTLIETAIMAARSLLGKKSNRLFLLAYLFTAAKLLTRPTKSLHTDGMRLNAILFAKAQKLSD